MALSFSNEGVTVSRTIRPGSKFFILFIAYLVTTHLFSELHTEYFKPIIDQQDYIYIRIPNNFWFKFLWTVIIIIISSYVYTTIIKPYIV